MLRKAFIIYRKDLKIEFRSLSVLLSMIFLAFLLLVLINFALGTGKKIDSEMAGGVLIVAIIFSSVFGQNRIFEMEKENSCMDALLISPAEPGSIFASKVAVNFTIMFISELIILPLFFILYGDNYASSLPFLMVLFFLLNLGFSLLGALFSAMTMSTGKKEFLLPILMFPASIPLVIGAVKVTGGLFSGKEPSSLKDPFLLLVAFDLIFSGTCWLLFDHVIREQ